MLNLPVLRAFIAGQATSETVIRERVMRRQRASHFLEAAKRAVEAAIKDLKAVAMAYLAAANLSDAEA